MGGNLVFPTNTDSGDTGNAAPPPKSTAQSSESAEPGGGTPTKPADPRTVQVPTDPLAGVLNPAYTRSDDLSQPHPDEWRASTMADNPEEEAAENAIRDHMKVMLATKDMDFMKPTVTFNKRAQTVVITGGPNLQIPEEYREVFRKAGEMAACSALAHRLKDAPTTWPYGRFSVYWKIADGDIDTDPFGFGQATEGCFTENAGQWQGTEEGVENAEIPSSDEDEIRIAGATVKAVNTAWNARVAEWHGLEPFDTDDAINLGFDPAEKAAYVWAFDGYGALTGRAQRANFQDTVSKTVCRRLMAEYRRNKTWIYTRWSVAVYEGNSGTPEIVGSGDCLP
ncbi:hypothetical protein [Streptomyces sp. NPDC002851]